MPIGDLSTAFMIDAQVSVLATRAARRAAAIAGKLRTMAMRQLQGGYPQDYQSAIILGLRDDLRDSMVVSHLSGHDLAVSLQPDSEQVPLKLELSLFSGMLKTLKARTKVNIDALQKQYDTHALRVLNGVSKKVEKELRAVVDGLLQERAIRSHAVRVLNKAFVKAGIAPKGDFQLETIFRTQSQIAYSAGRWEADSEVDDILWGYRYVTVGDDRVREQHEALEGVTLPKHDPFWDKFFPPNGWNCRCQAISIFDTRPRINPPKHLEDGTIVQPDAGFAFNPGKVFFGGSKLKLAFNPDQQRDDDGKFGSGSGGSGGKKVKAGKNKFVGARVDGKVHAFAESTKHRIAEGIGGIPEELTSDAGQKDKKPYDVKLIAANGSEHDIEVKSMSVGGKQTISVHDDALLRKVQHVKETGNSFHTVVVDGRESVNSENFSGHELYYKRGCGRYALSKMHKVKDESELKRLITTPDKNLPAAARGSLPPPPPLAKLKIKAAQASDSRKARDKLRKVANKDVLRQQARAAKKKAGA